MVTRILKKSGTFFGKRAFTINPLIIAILSFLLIAGCWLRINNLGLLSLIGDEGIQALSVEGILKHGYPLVPSGSVYVRSLLQTYIQYLSALIFGLNEFSLRLPGVLFNLGSIIMIFLFGRAVFNSKVGLLSAVIFTFSAWEIELSRYARMYTAFQFSYLLGLFTFYMGFIAGEKKYRFLVPPSFLLTFSLHRLGLTLLVTFLVPFFLKSYNVARKRTLLSYLVITFCGMLFYRKSVAFLQSSLSVIASKQVTLGTEVAREMELLGAVKNFIKSKFHLPAIAPLKDFYFQHTWVFLVLILVLLVISAYLVYLSYKTESRRREYLFAIPIIVSLAFYQFTLAILLSFLYSLLYYRDTKSLKSPVFILMYFMAIFSFLFWFYYIKFYFVPGKYFTLVDAFWGYPKLYKYFLYWFINYWPRFLTVIGVWFLSIVYLYLGKIDRTTNVHVFILLSCLLAAILASFGYWPWYEARYVFHLYPLLIIMFSACLCTMTGYISRGIVFQAERILKRRPLTGFTVKLTEVLILLFLAVFLSQDMYPTEALAISQRTYRTIKDPIKGSLNWRSYADFHQDCKNAALFVRERMTPNDKIMVMGAAHSAPVYLHYIRRVDYVVLKDPDWYGISTDNGVIHYITGSIHIADSYSLEQVVKDNDKHKIWVLTDFYLRERYYSPEIRRTINRLAKNRVFTAMDGKTFVYVIDSKVANLPEEKFEDS